VLLAEFDAVGLGVEDILMAASSCDTSDMSRGESEVMFLRDKYSSKSQSQSVIDLGSSFPLLLSQVNKWLC